MQRSLNPLSKQNSTISEHSGINQKPKMNACNKGQRESELAINPSGGPEEVQGIAREDY